MCNTYCFSRGTVVTRTRLSVTLYLHCLCFFSVLFSYSVSNELYLIILWKRDRSHRDWSVKWNAKLQITGTGQRSPGSASQKLRRYKSQIPYCWVRLNYIHITKPRPACNRSWTIAEIISLFLRSESCCAYINFSSSCRNSPQRARASRFKSFLGHTQRRTTVGRTPLDEWLACRRDLYLTTHNTNNRHPCPRCDSNPQSQQTSGRTPTPWTAWPLGPTHLLITKMSLYLL